MTGRKKRPARMAPGSRVWEAAWIPAADLTPDGEHQPFLGVALLVDATDGLVIGAEPTAQSDMESVARTLLQLMTVNRVSGETQSSRPGVLHLRDPELADALRALAALPIIRVVDQFEVLDAVAADLARTLSASAAAALAPLPESREMGELFRTATAFFNARPWRVLADDALVEVRVGDEKPRFASVLGRGEMSYGLALLEEPDAATSEAALNEARSLAVTFVAEAEVPDEWRLARRRNRWPIASPSAFPLPILHETGVASVPGERDLRVLDIALAAVAALVGRHGKRLEQGLASEITMQVPQPSGHALLVHARVFEPASASQHATLTAPVAGPDPALVVDWAMDLPDAHETVDRLAWSFFGASEPRYAASEREQQEAEARFFDWAIFAARPHAETLARRALAAMTKDMLPEQRAAYERIVTPVAGIFRVERLQRDGGADLLDLVTGKRLRVRERLATRQLRKGDTVVGMLHPVSEIEFLLSASVMWFPSAGTLAQREPGTAVQDFAPALETHFFGAGTGWIQSTPAEDVAAVYDDFREALAATGDRLPEFRTLQRRIAAAYMPTQVISSIANKVVWWSEFEFAVMAALLMRAWNMTPRPELAGLSPDEIVEGPKKRTRRRRRPT